MISYDEKVRKLLEDIDRSKVRVWALTNAYRIVTPDRILKRTRLIYLFDSMQNAFSGY
jgi:pyrimidine and pyridine-specific 5'-nucleotidase